MKEALFYEKLSNNMVKCNLCSHRCSIDNGKTGICNVRKNIDGTLYSLIYGKIVAKHIDPVEKKPLYHFLPSSYTFSLSTVGCNFKCKNCQNYEISQIKEIFGYNYSPEDVLKEVISNSLQSISYTYTEPTIYYEIAKDIGLLAKQNNIKNIFVSNGFMTKEVVSDLAKWLDAINIDLKSFSEEFYKKICKASLKPVLDNIIMMKENNIWVEVTTLVIPGYNDSEDELRNIAKFIKSVDEEIPWHVSAFYPTYILTEPPFTPPETLIKARLIGLSEGLKYVYTGNIKYLEGSTTYCPNCKTPLIVREGYSIKLSNIEKNKCVKCGALIAGFFN